MEVSRTNQKRNWKATLAVAIFGSVLATATPVASETSTPNTHSSQSLETGVARNVVDQQVLPPGQVCGDYTFGGDVLTGIPAADVRTGIPVNLADGEYTVVLTSSDSSHGLAHDADQLNEIWVLEGLNAAGEVVFETEATDDLPFELNSIQTDVGRVEAAGVVTLRPRHGHPIPAENSLLPARAQFIAESCPLPVTFIDSGASPDNPFLCNGRARTFATVDGFSAGESVIAEFTSTVSPVTLQASPSGRVSLSWICPPGADVVDFELVGQQSDQRSEFILFTADFVADGPPEGVEDLVLERTTSPRSSVRAVWSIPDSHDGTIASYVVSVNNGTPTTIPPGRSSFVAEGLQAGSFVQFAIVAVDINGNESEPVLGAARTDEALSGTVTFNPDGTEVVSRGRSRSFNTAAPVIFNPSTPVSLNVANAVSLQTAQPGDEDFIGPVPLPTFDPQVDSVVFLPQPERFDVFDFLDRIREPQVVNLAQLPELPPVPLASEVISQEQSFRSGFSNLLNIEGVAQLRGGSVIEVFAQFDTTLIDGLFFRNRPPSNSALGNFIEVRISNVDDDEITTLRTDAIDPNLVGEAVFGVPLDIADFPADIIGNIFAIAEVSACGINAQLGLACSNAVPMMFLLGSTTVEPPQDTFLPNSQGNCGVSVGLNFLVDEVEVGEACRWALLGIEGANESQAVRPAGVIVTTSDPVFEGLPSDSPFEIDLTDPFGEDRDAALDELFERGVRASDFGFSVGTGISFSNARTAGELGGVYACVEGSVSIPVPIPTLSGEANGSWCANQEVQGIFVFSVGGAVTVGGRPGPSGSISTVQFNVELISDGREETIEDEILETEVFREACLERGSLDLGPLADLGQISDACGGFANRIASLIGGDDSDDGFVANSDSAGVRELIAEDGIEFTVNDSGEFADARRAAQAERSAERAAAAASADSLVSSS